MFVQSFTTEEKVALKYALHTRPSVAYVLEYAPPEQDQLFRRVSEVVHEFRELRLGYIYPDRDSEVFVNYVAFPHYLLGYSILHRVSGEPRTYETVYVPNPWYSERRATLENPPNLNREQQRIIKETCGEIAWIFHDGDDWRDIQHVNGTEDIATPGNAGGRA